MLSYYFKVVGIGKNFTHKNIIQRMAGFIAFKRGLNFKLGYMNIADEIKDFMTHEIHFCVSIRRAEDFCIVKNNRTEDIPAKADSLCVHCFNLVDVSKCFGVG